MGRTNTQVDFIVPEKRPVGRPRKQVEEVKRGRGRPRKGEEVKPKRMVVHKRPDIKPENRLKYAERTVRNAERIYEKYEKEYPNPLNIDDKALLPEARRAWEYAFSQRQSTNICGRERIIFSGEELLFLFEAFCSYIRDNNFVKEFEGFDELPKAMPIVPNQTNFARWLGIRRHTISDVIEREDTKIAIEYRAMLADLLSEGAMIGAYSSSSTIFTLKNLCDWADKYEDRGKKEVPTVEEAEALMKSLGYTKVGLLDG